MKKQLEDQRLEIDNLKKKLKDQRLENDNLKKQLKEAYSKKPIKKTFLKKNISEITPDKWHIEPFKIIDEEFSIIFKDSPYNNKFIFLLQHDYLHNFDLTIKFTLKSFTNPFPEYSQIVKCQFENLNTKE